MNNPSFLYYNRKKDGFDTAELLDWLDYIEDIRQTSKVRHKLKDILVLVLFATLARADDWVEIQLFAQCQKEYLKKYIELKHGIPSHDTLCRVMSMISPDVLQQLYGKWQELLNREEGEILKRLFVLMEKQYVPMEQNINEQIMWYRRGVKKMDIF